MQDLDKHLNSPKPSDPPAKLPLSERLAFTPPEFASLFGRSSVWGYRLLYSGKIKAIRATGALMIPRSELERVLADVAIYDGDPARAPKARKAKAEASK